MAWDFKKLCEDKPAVKEAMDALGAAGPTVNVADKQVKGGYVDEDGGWCKAYYSSTDLLRLSEGMLEMAKWLDSRAMSANQ